MRGIKAEGGWAVVCTEETRDPSHQRHHALRRRRGCGTTATSRRSRAWPRRSTRHGALAGIELTHHGPHLPTADSRETPIGPVAPAGQLLRAGAGARDGQGGHQGLSRAGIARPRCAPKKAGFDIVYCYAGHDIALPMHFLQKRRNHRTDEYGGSLENRVRLLREMIEDTKEAVGDSCAVVGALRGRRAAGAGRHHQRQRRPRGRRDAGRAARSLGRERQRLGQRFRAPRASPRKAPRSSISPS